MIDAVVFDMDGLMFDTERMVTRTWKQAGAEQGVDIPEELSFATIGLDAEKSGRIFYEKLGDSFDYQLGRDRRVELMTQEIEANGMPIKPGLFELLDYLEQKGLPKAVASSTGKSRVEYYLQKAGIQDRFQALVCGDMIEHGKPEPDIFLKACALLGKAPENCLALEDSPAGIRAAYKGNLIPVMIPDQIPPTPEILVMVRAKKDSLFDVIAMLEHREIE